VRTSCPPSVHSSLAAQHDLQQQGRGGCSGHSSTCSWQWDGCRPSAQTMLAFVGQDPATGRFSACGAAACDVLVFAGMALVGHGQTAAIGHSWQSAGGCAEQPTGLSKSRGASLKDVSALVSSCCLLQQLRWLAAAESSRGNRRFIIKTAGCSMMNRVVKTQLHAALHPAPLLTCVCVCVCVAAVSEDVPDQDEAGQEGQAEPPDPAVDPVPH